MSRPPRGLRYRPRPSITWPRPGRPSAPARLLEISKEFGYIVGWLKVRPLPAVLRIDGFRVMIFTLDHDPPHVHAYHGGKIIGIETCAVRFSALDQRLRAQAVRIVSDHQEYLLKQWREYHGSQT